MINVNIVLAGIACNENKFSRMDKLSLLLFVLVHLNATHIQGKIIIEIIPWLVNESLLNVNLICLLFKYRYDDNKTRANKKKKKRKIHFGVILVISFSLYSAIISNNGYV